jgi:hypothetical protein
MTTLHHATALVLEQSLDQLRAAVDRLPGEAMDWNPLPAGNPVGVLVMHALTATEFWIGNACGKPASHQEYRTESRAPAFETRGMTKETLVAEIDASRGRLRALLNAGREEHLQVRVRTVDGEVFDGAYCLVHGVSHLREHVGHTETMSDFWGAGIGH